MSGHPSQQTDDRLAAGPVPRTVTGRLRGMSRQSKIVLAGAAVALLAIAAITVVTAGSKATPPRVQPVAKAFTLAILGHPGQHVSLARFAGRPLIVNFFASWCAPCKRETPLLARFYAEHGGRDLIIGIDANDQTAPAEKFVQAAGVTYRTGRSRPRMPGCQLLPRRAATTVLRHEVAWHLNGQTMACPPRGADRCTT